MIPVTLEQAFNVVFLNVQDLSFHLAVDFLAQNFVSIDRKDFLRLQLSAIEAIFSSQSLLLPNEDYIFQIFLFLLDQDRNSISLARYIHLYAVSSTLLTSFLTSIALRDLEEEFFANIKKRLSFPILISDGLDFPQTRWSNQRFFSQHPEKDLELAIIIDSLSSEKVDSKTKIFKFKQQFLLLEEKYKTLLTENEELSAICLGKEDEIQVLLADIDGVKEQLVSCSRDCQNLKNENVAVLAENAMLKNRKIEHEDIASKSLSHQDNLDLRTHLHTSEKENQKLAIEIQSLRQENESLSKEVSRLIFLLESKKGEKAKVIEDYENLVSHVAEIQSEFKRALEERDRKNQTFCTEGSFNLSLQEDDMPEYFEDIEVISEISDQQSSINLIPDSNHSTESIESFTIASEHAPLLNSSVLLDSHSADQSVPSNSLLDNSILTTEFASSDIVTVQDEKFISEVQESFVVDQTQAPTSQEVIDHLQKGKDILHSQNKGNKAVQEMADHFRFAADQRDIEGLVLFGCCLFRGWGVSANPNLARDCFSIAKDLGSIEGLVWYWICDWENGAVYFKEAADKGHPGALFWYGVCLFYGFVPNVDQSQAKRYFELTFEAGDSYWGNQFASLYRLGYFGIVQSEDWANHFEQIASSRPTNDTSFFYPGFF